MAKKNKVKIKDNIVEDDEKRWFFYRFRLKYSKALKPKWWIDIFIIDRIFRELLIDFEINICRFHRRFANDRDGHSVSLCCFITTAESEKIDKFITTMPEFTTLENSGLLRKYACEADALGIEGISDKNWPIEIQKSWPIFATGVSATVLSMLTEIKRDVPLVDMSNIIDVQDYYEVINKRMIDLWTEHGGHSFLHHLSAFFGYNTVKARQTVEMLF